MFAKIAPNVAPLVPNSFIDAAVWSVEFFIWFSAWSNVKPALFDLKNIFLNPVPAVLASKPLSVKVPINAVVFSKLTPAKFATGATAAIAVLNLVISKDELLNDLAITSVTLCV